MNPVYFNLLGYKVADPSHYDLIIKDFQRHVFPTQPKEWDGIIGPNTKAKINHFNKNNFCPEVFEPIKPYVPYSNEWVEGLMQKSFVGLGIYFNLYARENDFDVLHAIGHGALESGWGLSKIARYKNNLFGWNAVDNSAYNSAYGFASREVCIREWSAWFNKTYLLPTGKQYRGNNEYAVNIIYATSPVAGINKSFLVQNLRRQLI